MLRIGDFSKICQVSIKALRYWDEQNLLKPAKTDPKTGYRYYSVEQIRDVNQILAFRVMGLEIKQIKQLLQDGLTASDIRAMLRLKQVELEQKLTDIEATMMMVEARLEQIDHEGQIPGYEVSLKTIDPQTVLAVRANVPTMDDLVNLLEETHGYARSRLGTNLLAVFHDPAYLMQHMDVEVGFPTSADKIQPIALSDDRSMTSSQLPGVTLAATTVHVGKWNTLSSGYVHLGQWIQRNQYQIVGAGREVFHNIDWDDEHKATVTELQFPVSKVAS
jgi:DNA-binding transcriptional MerR regulator/effector-binding domain-containing protein